MGLIVAVIGCKKKATDTTPPTFSKDIAGLLYENCTPCHRPDAPGPFSLISYSDALRKAKTIVKVTQSGYMPPWPADPEYSHFKDERQLSAEQKQLLADWVAAGCPPGDTTNLPELPTFPKGSMIGQPDMVVPFPKPSRLKAITMIIFFW